MTAITIDGKPYMAEKLNAKAFIENEIAMLAAYGPRGGAYLIRVFNNPRWGIHFDMMSMSARSAYKTRGCHVEGAEALYA